MSIHCNSWMSVYRVRAKGRVQSGENTHLHNDQCAFVPSNARSRLASFAASNRAASESARPGMRCCTSIWSFAVLENDIESYGVDGEPNHGLGFGRCADQCSRGPVRRLCGLDDEVATNDPVLNPFSKRDLVADAVARRVIPERSPARSICFRRCVRSACARLHRSRTLSYLPFGMPIKTDYD